MGGFQGEKKKAVTGGGLRGRNWEATKWLLGTRRGVHVWVPGFGTRGVG